MVRPIRTELFIQDTIPDLNYAINNYLERYDGLIELAFNPTLHRETDGRYVAVLTYYRTDLDQEMEAHNG